MLFVLTCVWICLDLFDLFNCFYEQISRNLFDLLGLGSYRFPVNARIGFSTPRGLLAIFLRKRGAQSKSEFSDFYRLFVFFIDCFCNLLNNL